jgi:hypothetical protein
MAPLPPPESSTRPALSNGAGRQTRHIDRLTLAELSDMAGCPVVTARIPVPVRIRVLSDREARQRARIRRKQARRRYRRAHPWSERWPNAARCIMVAMLCMMAFLYIKGEWLSGLIQQHFGH